MIIYIFKPLFFLTLSSAVHNLRVILFLIYIKIKSTVCLNGIYDKFKRFNVFKRFFDNMATGIFRYRSH